MSAKGDAFRRLAFDRRKAIYNMCERRLYTQHEVGERFNITKQSVSRVVQIHKRYLERRTKGDIKKERDGRREVYINVGVRVLNCLRNSGIKSLEDLTYWTEAELLALPNLGRVSLVELRDECKKLGHPIGWNRHDS